MTQSTNPFLFIVLLRSSPSLARTLIYIYVRSVELYVHIFKVRVVGLPKKVKMIHKLQLHAERGSIYVWLLLSWVASVATLTQQSAIIENFLRFHLARKSITLLFNQNVTTQHTPYGAAKLQNCYDFTKQLAKKLEKLT